MKDEELRLRADESISHFLRNYDRVYHTSNGDGEHYYYDEEGPLRGYGMACHSDYFTLYEIEKEAYDGKYLPTDAKCIGIHNEALTVFRNRVCRISDKVGENHYLLKSMTGTLVEIENEGFFDREQSWKAVAVRIDCHCGERFWLDELPLPDNEAYQITCPKCGIIL